MIYNCGKKIEPGDDIVIYLTLPDAKKMPVGVLDKVLNFFALSSL
jgi:hypothetical protein